jgi:hypothetical protein
VDFQHDPYRMLLTSPKRIKARIAVNHLEQPEFSRIDQATIREFLEMRRFQKLSMNPPTFNTDAYST